MRILLIFLAAIAPIFASNLMTYNIYERTDRVDIMLSFDAPYEGNIFQKREKNKTMLVLNSLNYEESVTKNINSKIVQELEIEPKQNSVSLNLTSQDAIVVSASKLPDGFGLRIRITPKNTPAQVENLPQASAQINKPTEIGPQESESIVDTRYFIVLGALVALLLFLFVFKKYMVKKAANFKGFEGASKTAQDTQAVNWLLNQKGGVNVIFEKSLDSANKVMLLSYENRRYLVLVGSSNALLDSFGEEKIRNEQDFEVFFEENRKRLGSFLEDRQNSLSDYKNKMSGN